MATSEPCPCERAKIALEQGTLLPSQRARQAQGVFFQLPNSNLALHWRALVKEPIMLKVCLHLSVLAVKDNSIQRKMPHGCYGFSYQIFGLVYVMTIFYLSIRVLSEELEENECTKCSYISKLSQVKLYTILHGVFQNVYFSFLVVLKCSFVSLSAHQWPCATGLSRYFQAPFISNPVVPKCESET